MVTLKQSVRVWDRVNRLTGQRPWSAPGICVEHTAAIHEALPERRDTGRIVGTGHDWRRGAQELAAHGTAGGQKTRAVPGKGAQGLPPANSYWMHNYFKSLGEILLSKRGLARTTIPIRPCCFPSWAVAEAKGQANSQQKQKPAYVTRRYLMDPQAPEEE